MPNNNVGYIAKAAKAAVRNNGNVGGRFTEHGLYPDLNPEPMMRDATQKGFDYGKKTATAPLRVYENVLRLGFRSLQFILALVIVGIYGERVHKGHDDASDESPAWVFGLFVAVTSCVTAVLFAIAAPLGNFLRNFKTYRLFAWDLILFIMWIIVFGVFADIFLHRSSDDAYKGSSTVVEKGAMWINLVNSLLWLISGVYGSFKVFLGDKVNTLFGKVTDKAAGKIFTKKEVQHEEATAKHVEMHEQWEEDYNDLPNYRSNYGREPRFMV